MDKKNRFSLVITILFALLIFVLSVIPTDINGDTPSFYFPGMDKIIHALMYGIFTVLVLNQYLQKRPFRALSLLLLLVAVFSYSVLMELVQLYIVEYRSGDWKDAAANLSGIVFASLFVFLVKRFRS